MAAAATSSSSSPLESLPDDLLIDVLDHLDRARDISHLEQASRRTRAVVAQDGWRRFVRTRFGAAGGAHHYHPSSSYSSSPAAEWRSAADRLTYLDRCWDRRAVVLINFGEKKQGQQRQRREPRNGAAPQATQQSVGFHPALDAGLLPGGGGGELAAWGVGENLVTRVSAHGRPDEWRRLDGREEGYASGFGDVTAVSTLAYGGGQEPAVAVGRANGELRIVRASGPRFGETLRTVARKSDDTPSAGGTGTPTRKSPAQVAVSWTDWHAPSSFLASSCKTTISLHDLSRPADDDGGSEEEESLRPVLVYDAALEDDPNDVSLIRNVRFASRDTLAVSLGGTRHPLRWGRITPAGLVLDPVPRSGAEAADFLATRAEPDRGGRTTVRAVEPVPLSSSSSVSSSCPLLLSAWDDGSYRLTDPRTPSPHDASYRDRWQPYEPGGSLLVYGARHFVAGSNISPDLRFFDFRFPRSYHHADALPCSASPPVPRPPFVSRPGKGNDDDDDDDDDEEEEDEDERGTRATNNLKKNRRGGNPPACDHASGRRCAWHDLSRRPRWRPDATLHTGRSWRNRVHALAKAADASSRFYVGFEGAVTEVNLCLSRDVGGGDNSLLERTHPEGWEAVPSKGRVGLIENGVGLVDEREWNRAPTENLEIWHQNQEAILRGTTTTAPTDTNGSGANGSGGGGGGEGKGHSRLDEAYVPPPPRREGEVRRSQRGWRS